MDQKQLDVINITQEVLRVVVISLGALNVQAMPKVAHTLRAGSMDETVSPIAQAMLADIAEGIELVTGQGAASSH